MTGTEDEGDGASNKEVVEEHGEDEVEPHVDEG